MRPNTQSTYCRRIGSEWPLILVAQVPDKWIVCPNCSLCELFVRALAFTKHRSVLVQGLRQRKEMDFLTVLYRWRRWLGCGSALVTSVHTLILFIRNPAHALGDRIPALLAIIPPELQFRLYLSNKSMKHKEKELQDKAEFFCQCILNISVCCSCYICILSCKYIYKINSYSSCICLLVYRAVHHFWI